MGEKNFHLCLSIYFHHQAHLQEQWYEYEDDNSLQNPRYEECRYTLYQLPGTLHLLTIHSMWLKQHDTVHHITASGCCK